MAEPQKESPRAWMFRNLSATTGGPQAVQEQQSIDAARRGISSPAEAAEHPIQTAVNVLANTANAITGGNPLRFAAETAGMATGAAMLGRAGRYFLRPIGQRLLPRLSQSGAALLERYGQRLGRIPGAGLGTVAGGDVAQAFADETPEQTRTRRLHELGIGMFAEAAAPALQFVTKPISRAIRGKLAPYGDPLLLPETQRIQSMLKGRGLDPLSPGQAMGGWVDLWENLGSSSVMGGSMVAGRRAAGEASAIQNWEMTVNEFGGRTTPEQMAASVTSALDNAADIQRAYTRGKYQAFDTEVKKAGGVADITIHPVLQTELSKRLRRMASLNPPDPDATRILSLLESGSPMSPAIAAQASKVLGPSGQPAFVTPAVPAKPLPIDIALASELRSDLQAIGRRRDLPIPDVAALARKAAADVDIQINAAIDRLGVLGPAVKAAGQEAREVARWSKETFNDPAIVSFLSKQTPEEAASFLLADKAPTRLNRVYDILQNPRFRDVIPDPDAIWRQVEGAWLHGVEVASGKGPGSYGSVQGSSIMDKVRSADTTVGAIFRTPEQRQALYDSGHALDMAQNPGGSRVGMLAIGLRQTAALASTAAQLGAIGSGGFIQFGVKGLGTSAVILGAPWAIARAMASKKVAAALEQWAATKSTRIGYRSAQIAAFSASKAMTEAGIPHVLQDEQGNLINPLDILTGHKPVSKF